MGKIADVSHHQGVIDWAKASKELDLVIIRLSMAVTQRTNSIKIMSLVLKNIKYHMVYIIMRDLSVNLMPFKRQKTF